MTENRKGRTRLDPAVRRRQIAEAAAKVFSQNDPSDVSFELVADEAGVSRSLVYSYFGDRGSLFAAAYSHELARLDEAIDGALEALGADRAALRRAVRAYLDFAWRNRSSWQLIASASASRHPAVQQAIRERTERIASSMTAARASADGPEARMLVRGVIGMLEAAAIQTLEHEDVDVDQLAELLTQIIWDGVSSFGLTSA